MIHKESVRAVSSPVQGRTSPIESAASPEFDSTGLASGNKTGIATHEEAVIRFDAGRRPVAVRGTNGYE